MGDGLGVAVSCGSAVGVGTAVSDAVGVAAKPGVSTASGGGVGGGGGVAVSSPKVGLGRGNPAGAVLVAGAASVGIAVAGGGVGSVVHPAANSNASPASNHPSRRLDMLIVRDSSRPSCFWGLTRL